MAGTAPPTTGARIVPQQTLPAALKVHPKGFKVLSRASPIERALTSYFRLPPEAAAPRRREEDRVKRMLRLRAAQRQRPRELDGFLLLETAGVEDPEDAVEASLTDEGLASAVAADLSFFTSLEFLDVGENRLALSDLAPLKALEELHMHCCRLRELEVPAGAFQKVETLNLSFNHLPPQSLTALFALPSLLRLDLSCNDLTELPADLSPLAQLQQMALENNRLGSDKVFEALGTLRQLREVNLNKNPLTRAPKLAEGTFPSLQVIGLADCQFQYFEDLFALTEWGRSKGQGGLHRAVLWGNPIERRRRDLDILCYELAAFDIQVMLDPPVPPKRKVGEFYAASTRTLRKVADFRTARGADAGAAAAAPVPAAAEGQPAQGPGQAQPPPEHPRAEDQDGSFFVTQGVGAGAVQEGRQTPRAYGGSAAPAASRQGAAAAASAEQPDPVWFPLGLQEPAAVCRDLNREIDELLLKPSPSPDATADDIAALPGDGAAGVAAPTGARRLRPPTRPASRRGVPRNSVNPPTLRAAHMLLRAALAHPITQPQSCAAARTRGPRRPTPGKYANIYADTAPAHAANSWRHSKGGHTPAAPPARLPPLPPGQHAVGGTP
eukprot:TRINITY_DN18436_c0_g1_i1.p1 TRINITY_DN18436_c0_g1~~TRINITY_DN18436_c0_g1_i1.p1  ORF type:complete len:696 (+),score=270.63 TRINITY_DN18436_c0_g1_i1:260-2089(+)